MHGRLKVKTTAEQQEAKRKEREKKLKLYTGATERVFQKRSDGEYDDEALEITSNLLSSNPDFYTLWNYRREIFLDLTKHSESQEMRDRYSKELKFLEACLMVNPKSYGSWHHRGWVMDHMPEPDWKQEVALCNQYLEFDERNFHCWDYRRIVVSRARVPPAEELTFTDSKILSNFSNYSSWHYRSKLLPLLHPDLENKGRVKEDVLLRDYELVQNAFFTDPNDQSAWFYQRWLLGRAEKPKDIGLLYTSREPCRIVATFTQPLKLSEDVTVTVNGSRVSGTWRNSQGTSNHALVWVYVMSTDTLPAQSTLEVCLSIDELSVSKKCSLTADQTEGWCRESTDSVELFTAQLSVEKSGVLTQELESCQQLQELEPNNKWCVLTIILLMRAIDPLKYEAETLRYFNTLLETDPCRAGYFLDLRSTFVIENILTQTIQQQSASRELDLSGKKLTTLRHTEHMMLMTRVNLSSNQLPSLKGCHTLLCAQTLLADNNSIHDLQDLSTFPCLETLSLKENSIGTVQDLEALRTSTRLQCLDLRSNPVCDIPDFQLSVKVLLPQLTTLNGEIL